MLIKYTLEWINTYPLIKELILMPVLGLIYGEVWNQVKIGLLTTINLFIDSLS